MPDQDYNTLPDELKAKIIAHLDKPADLKTISKISKQHRHLAMWSFFTKNNDNAIKQLHYWLSKKGQTAWRDFFQNLTKQQQKEWLDQLDLIACNYNFEINTRLQALMLFAQSKNTNVEQNINRAFNDLIKGSDSFTKLEVKKLFEFIGRFDGVEFSLDDDSLIRLIRYALKKGGIHFNEFDQVIKHCSDTLFRFIINCIDAGAEAKPAAQDKKLAGFAWHYIKKNFPELSDKQVQHLKLTLWSLVNRMTEGRAESCLPPFDFCKAVMPWVVNQCLQAELHEWLALIEDSISYPHTPLFGHLVEYRPEKIYALLTGAIDLTAYPIIEYEFANVYMNFQIVPGLTSLTDGMFADLVAACKYCGTSVGEEEFSSLHFWLAYFQKKINCLSDLIESLSIEQKDVFCQELLLLDNKRFKNIPNDIIFGLIKSLHDVELFERFFDRDPSDSTSSFFKLIMFVDRVNRAYKKNQTDISRRFLQSAVDYLQSGFKQMLVSEKRKVAKKYFAILQTALRLVSPQNADALMAEAFIDYDFFTYEPANQLLRQLFLFSSLAPAKQKNTVGQFFRVIQQGETRLYELLDYLVGHGENNFMPVYLAMTPVQRNKFWQCFTTDTVQHDSVKYFLIDLMQTSGQLPSTIAFDRLFTDWNAYHAWRDVFSGAGRYFYTDHALPDGFLHQVQTASNYIRQEGAIKKLNGYLSRNFFSKKCEFYILKKLLAILVDTNLFKSVDCEVAYILHERSRDFVSRASNAELAMMMAQLQQVINNDQRSGDAKVFLVSLFLELLSHKSNSGLERSFYASMAKTWAPAFCQFRATATKSNQRNYEFANKYQLLRSADALNPRTAILFFTELKKAIIDYAGGHPLLEQYDNGIAFLDELIERIQFRQLTSSDLRLPTTEHETKRNQLSDKKYRVMAGLFREIKTIVSEPLQQKVANNQAGFSYSDSKQEEYMMSCTIN